MRVADLAAQARRNARRDAAHARAAQSSGLPSGRTTYRRLPDYDLEMKNLAMQYPSLVRPITLNHRSLLGRDVNGIEISTGAQNTGDGKPIFLIMGVHHAREWPSAEHTIEFAYDLAAQLRARRADDAAASSSTRTIVVPVVNPDGFNISREAATLGDFSLFDYEMKRKNCRVSANTPTKYAKGACDDNKAGRLRGTDPNRNYGGLWGGSGASTIWSDDTYRGDGPFSEPEVQNIRELISSRQVTNLITNHTFSNLVLRPPGVASFGFPLEEPIYKALGASLAAHNGYSNIPGFGLYDTTGATEDWSFWSTGGLAFTFEIGGIDFHPAFHDGVEAEYLGEAPATGAGKGGNREAYYTMLAGDGRQLAPLADRGLRARRLDAEDLEDVPDLDVAGLAGRLRQRRSATRAMFTDTLTSELKAPGGSFTWNVNPSTRPVVAGRHGRDADRARRRTRSRCRTRPGCRRRTRSTRPAGRRRRSRSPCKGPADGVDNGWMTVHIEWSSPDTDWDVYVIGPNGDIVTQSASFGDTTEDAVLFDPPPGQYKAVVVNYDQVMNTPDDWFGGKVTFRSPDPRIETGVKEAWTLTCTDSRGRVQASRQVVVDRGAVAHVGNACQRRQVAQLRLHAAGAECEHVFVR